MNRTRRVRSSNDPNVYLRIILSNMKQRCHNPKHESYKFYGAKGVQIFGPWENPEVFVRGILEEIGPRPTDEVRKNGLSVWELDRTDSYGNYEPGNVRWLHHLANQRNKRQRVSTPRPRKEKYDLEAEGLPWYISNVAGQLILNRSAY
jgi:hypothetical protein